MIVKRIDWLSQRQRVLADNIANADTPEFVPRDLNEGQFGRILRRRLQPVEHRATNPAHLAGTVPKGGAVRSEPQAETYETSPPGKAVVPEEQLIKVGKTQSDFQTMTNLYRKHMDMFLLVLRSGGW